MFRTEFIIPSHFVNDFDNLFSSAAAWLGSCTKVHCYERAFAFDVKFSFSAADFTI